MWIREKGVLRTSFKNTLKLKIKNYLKPTYSTVFTDSSESNELTDSTESTDYYTFHPEPTESNQLELIEKNIFYFINKELYKSDFYEIKNNNELVSFTNSEERLHQLYSCLNNMKDDFYYKPIKYQPSFVPTYKNTSITLMIILILIYLVLFCIGMNITSFPKIWTIFWIIITFIIAIVYIVF